jgi:hypothetical protein
VGWGEWKEPASVLTPKGVPQDASASGDDTLALITLFSHRREAHHDGAPCEIILVQPFVANYSVGEAAGAGSALYPHRRGGE